MSIRAHVELVVIWTLIAMVMLAAFSASWLFGGSVEAGVPGPAIACKKPTGGTVMVCRMTAISHLADAPWWTLKTASGPSPAIRAWILEFRYPHDLRSVGVKYRISGEREWRQQTAVPSDKGEN